MVTVDWIQSCLELVESQMHEEQQKEEELQKAVENAKVRKSLASHNFSINCIYCLHTTLIPLITFFVFLLNISVTCGSVFCEKVFLIGFIFTVYILICLPMFILALCSIGECPRHGK